MTKRRPVSDSRERKADEIAGREAVPWAEEHRRRLIGFVCAGLLALNFAAFEHVRRCDFTNYDENQCILAEPGITNGISWEGLKWVFSADLLFDSKIDFWMPVTYATHQAVFRVFGFKPAGHHLTNLFLHSINAILLFLVLLRMRGALWPCAFAAALWAVHPLRVESVAWVMERKDVVSAFFWLVTIRVYIRYAERPTAAGYLWVVMAFAMGLMSKPMLVTLPIVLWLLDYWPLGRLTFRPFDSRRWVKIAVEKIPLFALSAALSALILSQHLKQIDIQHVTPFLQASNALVSYVKYLELLLWPRDLAVFYPFPKTLPPVWQIGGAALILLAVTAWCLREGSRRPYLAVGWFWYLVTLMPVIGMVRYARADRYTYIPHMGLCVLLAWILAEASSGWRRRPAAFFGVCGGVLLAFVIMTRAQVLYWTDSLTLFERALRVTQNNTLAELNFGAALAAVGKNAEANVHYREAIRIEPWHPDVYNNLGNSLAREGKLEEAVRYFSEAVRYIGQSQNRAAIYTNLATALLSLGRHAEAEKNYRLAIQFNPNDAPLHNHLGFALARQDKLDEAAAAHAEAILLDPNRAESHYYLGNILADQRKFAEAARYFSEAIRLNPGYPEARDHLKKVRRLLSNPALRPPR